MSIIRIIITSSPHFFTSLLCKVTSFSFRGFLVILLSGFNTSGGQVPSIADEAKQSISFLLPREIPPIIYSGNDGTIQGIAADYLEEITAATGLVFDIISGTESELKLDEFREDSSMVMMVTAKTPGTAKKYLLTQSFTRCHGVIVGKKTYSIVTALEDLEGRKVSIISASPAAEFLPVHHPGIEIIEAGSSVEGLDLLKRGDCDAFIGNSFSVEYYLSQDAYRDLAVTGDSGFYYEFVFAISGGVIIASNSILNSLESIIAGQGAEITGRWVISEEQKYKSLRKALLLISIILVASVTGSLLVIIWNYSLKRKVEFQTLQLEKELAERVKAEEKRRSSEIEKDTILSAIPDMMIRIDGDGIITGVSGIDHWPDYSAETIVNKPVKTVFPLDFNEKFDSHVSKLKDSGESQVFDFQLDKDSETKYFETRIVSSGDNKILMICRDMTDLRLSRNARLQSERLYQMINDTLQEGLGIVDPAENFIFVNEAMAEIAGCSQDELIGRSLKELVSEEMFSTIRKETEKRARGEHSRYIVKITNFRGEKREIEVSTSPWVDEDGKYLGSIGLSLDITKLKQISAELRATEDRYQSMADSVQDGLAIIENGSVVYLNDRYCEIFGYTREELLEISSIDLAAPEEKDRLSESFKRQQSRPGSNVDLEFRIIRKDGELRFVHFRQSTSRNYKDETGEYITITDITDKKLAEFAKKRTDKILRTVNVYSQEFLHSGINENIIQEFIDELGMAAEVSRTYVFENSHDKNGELVCLHKFEWCAPGVITQIDKTGLYEQNYNALGFGRWVESMEEGESVYGNITEFPPDEVKFLEPQKIASLLAVPIMAGGHWWGFIGFDQCESEREWTYMDIEALRTAASILGAAIHRGRAESYLRMREEQFREMANLLPGIVFELNTKGLVTFVNSRSFDITGYDITDFNRGFNAKELFVLEDRRRIFRTVRRIIEGNRIVSMECQVKRKDESTFPAILQAAPILEGDRITGVRGIVLDITDRKKYENELKVNEARIEALYRLGQMDSASVDEISEFVLKESILLTDSRAGFLGILDEEEKELEIAAISEPAAAACSMDEVKKIKPFKPDSGWAESIRSRKPFIANNYPGDNVGNSPPEGHIELTRYISVPIHIGSHIAAVIIIGNKDSDYNENDIRQISLLGSGAWKHLEKIRAEAALKRSESRYRALFEGSPDAVYISTLEGQIIDINKAGEEIFGYEYTELIGMNTLQFYADPKDRDRLAEEIQQRGYIRNFAVRMLRKDGKIIDCLITSSVRKSPEDDAVYYQGIIRDVTELKRLESQLIQSQKMESVGRLAGGAAHDFNNLLTAIMGNTDMMLLSTPSEDPLHSGLQEIREAADRAAILTRQLLAFSRKQTLQPKILNLDQIISNMDMMLRRIIGEDVNLVTIPHEGLWNVKADPNQVETVIINLAVNARDALPNGGKLTIETANIILDDIYSRRHPETLPGSYSMLTISDDGEGIPAGVIDHIFDPFFTTKEAGKGTGLGLSTVYGIIKQSGGNINVSSEFGKGSVFKIHLPATEESLAEDIQKGFDEDKAPGGNETILVVEDDMTVRRMAVMILKTHGYDVLEAEGSLEALQLWQKSEKKIDLLLTDVIMPQMSGPELAKKIKRTSPELKVLYMSGYAPNIIVQQRVLDPDIAYLQKPFRPKSLVQKVREVIDYS